MGNHYAIKPGVGWRRHTLYHWDGLFGARKMGIGTCHVMDFQYEAQRYFEYQDELSP